MGKQCQIHQWLFPKHHFHFFFLQSISKRLAVQSEQFVLKKFNQVSVVYLDSGWCLGIARWKHNMCGSEAFWEWLQLKNNMEDGDEIFIINVSVLILQFENHWTNIVITDLRKMQQDFPEKDKAMMRGPYGNLGIRQKQSFLLVGINNFWASWAQTFSCSLWEDALCFARETVKRLCCLWGSTSQQKVV